VAGNPTADGRAATLIEGCSDVAFGVLGSRRLHAAASSIG
jgi:hypothetical protein